MAFNHDNAANPGRELLKSPSTYKALFWGSVGIFIGYHDLIKDSVAELFNFKKGPSKPIHMGVVDYLTGSLIYWLNHYIKGDWRSAESKQDETSNYVFNGIRGLLFTPFVALNLVRLVVGYPLGFIAGAITCTGKFIGQKFKNLFSQTKTGPRKLAEATDKAPNKSISSTGKVICLGKNADNKVNLDELPQISKGLCWRITKTGKKEKARFQAVSIKIPEMEEHITRHTSKIVLSSKVYNRTLMFTGSKPLCDAMKSLDKKSKQKQSRSGAKEVGRVTYRLIEKENLPKSHTYTYIPG